MFQATSPPSDWKGILRQLGPGLIISANIVGSGELIMTTKLGAEAGFALLWFIILGCMIKVFLQVELARYAITRGSSTLEALDSVPGPRIPGPRAWAFGLAWCWSVVRKEVCKARAPQSKGLSWLVGCWVVMFVATFFQLSGMVGSIAEVFRMGGLTLPNAVWAFFITASCAALLFVGRYGFIEKFSTGMVAGFTLFTIASVFSLHWTDYGITAGNLAEGLQFRLPDKFTTAFAAFGIIGVGASELIYYPYWCLEKGYAKRIGPDDGTEAWRKRAQGWIRVLQWDAWLSMIIYTVATVAFYLLGAAVLHSQGLKVENEDMISTLSNLYQASFGSLGLVVFLIGATIVLYSTLFISTASNARLTADLLRIGNWVAADTETQRRRHIKTACVVLPALYFVFFMAVGEPLTLVLIGALAQALMLPFLCFAVLWFHYRKPPEVGGRISAALSALRPGKVWMMFLWIASVLMASAGMYQLVEKLRETI